MFEFNFDALHEEARAHLIDPTRIDSNAAVAVNKDIPQRCEVWTHERQGWSRPRSYQLRDVRPVADHLDVAVGGKRDADTGVTGCLKVNDRTSVTGIAGVGDVRLDRRRRRTGRNLRDDATVVRRNGRQRRSRGIDGAPRNNHVIRRNNFSRRRGPERVRNRERIPKAEDARSSDLIIDGLRRIRRQGSNRIIDQFIGPLQPIAMAVEPPV